VVYRRRSGWQESKLLQRLIVNTLKTHDRMTLGALCDLLPTWKQHEIEEALLSLQRQGLVRHEPDPESGAAALHKGFWCFVAPRPETTQ